MAGWTAAEIPGQRGKVAVVTGANSGLGFVTARELARAGAAVVLACRNAVKGERAVSAIVAELPAADARVAELDLASLASVRAFSDWFAGEHGRLDLLVNNAGVMAPPRRLTEDGFETQFGTNHLGHFALTGLLLARLLAAPLPRVVTLSSGMHRGGTIEFADLQRTRSYNGWRAYSQSKLANLLFCFELGRRAAAADTSLTSVAAHPGYAATNLQFAGPSRVYERVAMAVSNKVIAQSAEMGALPTLYAATVPDLPSGAFVGPDGLFEGRGHPRIVTAAGKAYDPVTARRLWEASEELTGVRYEFRS